MIVKQVSIFIENRSGRLHEVFRTLGRAGISIKALSVSDTSDFGILRLIVGNAEKAVEILKENRFKVHLTDVFMIGAADLADGLGSALEVLAEAGISIEYMYAFSSSEREIVVMRTDNPERTVALLREKEIETLGNDFLGAYC
jgi:hypothetical protein